MTDAELAVFPRWLPTRGYHRHRRLCVPPLVRGPKLLMLTLIAILAIWGALGLLVAVAFGWSVLK